MGTFFMSTPKIEYKNRYKRYSIMQVQIRNLQWRASGYFFRMGIPKDLQNHFDGKREIVKSLKTKDSNFAVIKAHEIAEVYNFQFRATY